ncbi:MAG: sulfite exporter TauE/SafE family protein [Bacteroidales bacterium]|nr:sulfite exporter TauE/SafE family protein [Bacteroidales bacterium]
MKMTFTTILILMIIGLLAGILSGFAGVGGGVIIIPALIFFLGMTQFEAQGTSLALMIPPIGFLAAVNYYKEGYINWKYAIILALFFFIGGYIGSKMALTIPQNIVKKGFAVFIILVGVKMLVGK